MVHGLCAVTSILPFLYASKLVYKEITFSSYHADDGKVSLFQAFNLCCANRKKFEKIFPRSLHVPVSERLEQATAKYTCPTCTLLQLNENFCAMFQVLLLIAWACMADCCVVPSGVMFSGRYGFYLFVSIYGWLRVFWLSTWVICSCCIRR